MGAGVAFDDVKANLSPAGLLTFAAAYGGRRGDVLEGHGVDTCSNPLHSSDIFDISGRVRSLSRGHQL